MQKAARPPLTSGSSNRSGTVSDCTRRLDGPEGPFVVLHGTFWERLTSGVLCRAVFPLAENVQSDAGVVDEW